MNKILKQIPLLACLFVLNSQLFSQENDKIPLLKIITSWRTTKTDSFKINIDCKIPKMKCLYYLGPREYSKLRHDSLRIPLMGYQIIEEYNPKIFDIENLYLCDGNYFDYTYAHKDSYNIFFAKVDKKTYIVSLLFYDNRWHINAYSPYAPFFWKPGTRINY